MTNDPAAWGLLAGLVVLLLAAVALGCDGGCAGYDRLPRTPRHLETQSDTVVRVETFCVTDDPFLGGATIGFLTSMGSGVILDARHVLTAQHVIACPYLPDVHVVTVSGKRLRVVVTRENSDGDLALLEIASAEHFVGADGRDIAPPVIGPRPRLGDTICKLEAVPNRGGDCGTVNAIDDDYTHSDVGHDAPTKHGNSGGPAYDSQGRLVGITTRLLLPDGSAGGRFTSLAERGKELMP
jgi:S1-C subfamily serine protease